MSSPYPKRMGPICYRCAVPWLCCLAAACQPLQEDSTRRVFEEVFLTRLDVRSDVGDVRVYPGEAITITANLEWIGDEPPELSMRAVGEMLLVRTSCDGRPRCLVNVDIEAPPQLHTSLEAGTGQLEVSGMQGSLDVQSKNGDLIVSDSTGMARLQLVRGDLTLENIAATIDATVQDGVVVGSRLSSDRADIRGTRHPITLTFDAAPTLLEVETTTGAIDLSLPAGGYDIETHTQRGQVVMEEIQDTSNATSVILLRTTRGDVRVQGR